MKTLAQTGRGGVRAALGVLAALALAAAAASCTDKNAGPTWRGSFTSATSTCGGSPDPVAIDPPIEATIESGGDFAPGQTVELYPDGDCGFPGVIAADGSLRAVMHPGCTASAYMRSTITIENVFAARTTIRQTSDYLDPQACDVEVWGTFDRD